MRSVCSLTHVYIPLLWRVSENQQTLYWVTWEAYVWPWEQPQGSPAT